MKRFNGIFILCFLLLSYNHGWSSDSLPSFAKNKFLSVEIGGNGIAPSFNFETIINKKYPFVNVRAGLQAFPFRIEGFTDYRSVGIVSELSLLTGKDRNHFETGVGFSYIHLYDDIYGDENLNLELLVLRLGYRHYSKTGKSFFKIAYTPMFVLNKPGDEYTEFDPRVIPFFLGLGYGFKL